MTSATPPHTPSKTAGKLYVVATPIGNLDDLTPRALAVLQSVDVIAAEDTRHAKKLLQPLGIKTQLVAYHDHNEQALSNRLIAQIIDGQDIALISDAGTPLISDPGFRLTQAAHAHKVKVVPVVGACAAIAALSVAGLPSDRFSFEGFLPNKASQRKTKLASLAKDSQTLIFYESPHRIISCLDDMADTLGHQRLACFCRELTKTFETIKQGTLSELIQFVGADSNQQKGEIVLVVSGYAAQKNEDSTSDVLLIRLLQDLSVKKASQLASDITGIKKNTLYQRALLLQSASNADN